MPVNEGVECPVEAEEDGVDSVSSPETAEDVEAFWMDLGRAE